MQPRGGICGEALKAHVAAPPAPEERDGLFEGWVAALLRAYGHHRDLFDDWAFWAPAEARATEVDFVLRRGRESLAIEAKTSPKVRPEDLRGLRAIADLEGLVRRVLISTVARARRTADGIDVLPLPAFLDQLRRGRLWP
jgi:predicted AAA+ superfamily ATPase